MIRNIEEAKAALKQILQLSDGKQQVVQITIQISQCVNTDARKFLTAARERILKLQTKMKTRMTEARPRPAAPPAPAEVTAPPPPRKTELTDMPETGIPGPPPAGKAPVPAPAEKRERTIRTRKPSPRTVSRARASSGRGAGSTSAEMPTRNIPVGGGKPAGFDPNAPMGDGPKKAAPIRAQRKTESFETTSDDGEDIPILPEDRILDEEFVLMFESLEKFASQGVPVKEGPPPDQPLPDIPAPRKRPASAAKSAAKAPSGKKAPPPRLPSIPMDEEKPVEKPRPKPERIEGASVAGTAIFAEIRDEIEAAAPPHQDVKDETKEYKKENLEHAVEDFNNIVSEIESSEEEGKKYTGTRAFIREGGEGNVVFLDAWELHPDGDKGKPETPVEEADGEAETVMEERKEPVPAVPPPAETPRKVEERPTPAPEKPSTEDVASEVIQGLQKKVHEKQSSTEELKKGAPAVQGGTAQGPDEAPGEGEPPPPAAELVDSEASTEGEEAPFPLSIPADQHECIDDYCAVLEAAGRDVPRPIVARTVADDMDTAKSLCEKALAARASGSDLAFREAAGQLYNNQMTWKVRYARRLTRIERYIHSLLKGSHVKGLDPSVTPEETRGILDTIFSVDVGVETFSAFTVSGPSSDRDAARLILAMVKRLRQEGA